MAEEIPPTQDATHYEDDALFPEEQDYEESEVLYTSSGATKNPTPTSKLSRSWAAVEIPLSREEHRKILEYYPKVDVDCMKSTTLQGVRRGPGDNNLFALESRMAQMMRVLVTLAENTEDDFPGFQALADLGFLAMDSLLLTRKFRLAQAGLGFLAP